MNKKLILGLSASALMALTAGIIYRDGVKTLNRWKANTAEIRTDLEKGYNLAANYQAEILDQEMRQIMHDKAYFPPLTERSVSSSKSNLTYVLQHTAPKFETPKYP